MNCFFNALNSIVQLIEYDTDPFYLQIFQFRTMLIHAFCKICEHEIVYFLFLEQFQVCNSNKNNFMFANLTKHVNDQTKCLIALKKN